VATVPVLGGSTLWGGGTLFEMPQTVGSLAAGTLLYGNTYLQGSQKAIEIYTSTDAGVTWNYLDTPIIGGNSSQGLWEPEFEVANDGSLVIFWSDETDPCCSQKLAQMRTYNGSYWQDRQNTVASPNNSDRPGMAGATKLSAGTYFMTYEDCGPAACTVYYRTSTDGWNRGASSNMGTKLQTPAGQYFEHSPTNAWSPSVLCSNGAILVIGQVFYESNGAVSAQNGEVILENLSADGNSGNWVPIGAPVQVPGAYDNYCPNYSSAILPATGGSSILDLTSTYSNSGNCGGYYASETWNNLQADGSTYSFINLASLGLCLDDLGWGTANNTEADLWTSSGSIIQQWTVNSKGRGWFSLSNQDTGLCVDNIGGSQTPGNPVTLWGRANNSSQNGQFMDRGNAVYELMNQASGSLMLDDGLGSTTPGTQLEIWIAMIGES
jgi:hypothetical protein